MKKLMYLTVLISLLSCNKMQYGYKVFNQGNYDLILTVPDGSYIIKPKQTIEFKSESKDMESFVYIYDANVKPLPAYLGTHPIRHINVTHYTYDFVVIVGPKNVFKTDSVRIRINEKYFNEEIPFTYGTNQVPSNYNIESIPTSSGYTTRVKYKGKTIDNYDHFKGEMGKLSGSINNYK